MDIFSVVKENVTARQTAEFYGLHVGKNGMACCPFHPDHTPSLKLDNRFHCFGCGADGDAINYVSRLYGLRPYEAAKKILADFKIRSPASSYRYPSSGVNVARKKQIDAAFQKKWQRICDNYREYLSWLIHWMLTEAPAKSLDDVSPHFEEACHQIDFITYRLEDMCFHWSTNEKKEFYVKEKKEIKHIEERIREIRTEYDRRTTGEGTATSASSPRIPGDVRPGTAQADDCKCRQDSPGGPLPGRSNPAE